VFILCKISRFLYSARLAWNCLFTSLWGSFGGTYPQMNSDIVASCNPQKDRLWANTRRMSHKLWISNPQVRPGRVPEKKIQYNQQTRKNSQNRNISPIWGEAPAERIEMKICTSVEFPDIIMDAKFKFEKFQGFWCHCESKFTLSHWLYTWALPQCSATALPVICLFHDNDKSMSTPNSLSSETLSITPDTVWSGAISHLNDYHLLRK